MESRSIENHFGMKRKRTLEEQEGGEDGEWMDGNSINAQNFAKRVKHSVVEYIDVGDASEATDSRCTTHIFIGPQYRPITNSCQSTKAFNSERYGVATGNMPSGAGTMVNQSTDWWQTHATAWTRNRNVPAAISPTLPIPQPTASHVHQMPPSQSYSRQQTTTNFVQTKNLIVHRGQEQHAYMF